MYGIDTSNNVDKLDPWEMGIECLLRSDGRDRGIRENSKFSIKNLEVPMNVGEVSDQIKKLLKLLKSKQSNVMKQPIEDFFGIMWIPTKINMARWYDAFHTNPTEANLTDQSAFSTSTISTSGANKLLHLSNIQHFKPIVLNLFRDVNDVRGY